MQWFLQTENKQTRREKNGQELIMANQTDKGGTSWSDINAGLVNMWKEYWRLKDTGDVARANHLKELIVQTTKIIKRS